MKYLFSSAFLLICFISDLNAQIQDTTRVVTVETKKRKLIVGELIGITSDSILINDKEGVRIAFYKKNVKSVHNGLIPTHFNATTTSSVPYYVQTAMPTGE